MQKNPKTLSQTSIVDRKRFSRDLMAKLGLGVMNSTMQHSITDIKEGTFEFIS